jgi:thymidine kinase
MTLEEVNGSMRIDADIDVIAIDEGQFFGDLKKYVLKFCEEYGKMVIVAGLISDYQRKKFGSMTDLFYYADEIVHLKSLCTYCKDGTVGIFTKKVCETSDQIDVGSADKYIALCRKCYLK